MSLTEVGAFQKPVLEAAGTTTLGDALWMLMERLEREVRKMTANP